MRTETAVSVFHARGALSLLDNGQYESSKERWTAIEEKRKR